MCGFGWIFGFRVWELCADSTWVLHGAHQGTVEGSKTKTLMVGVSVKFRVYHFGFSNRQAGEAYSHARLALEGPE